jgi:hypothetical protein
MTTMEEHNKETEDLEDVYELTPLQQGMLLHSLYDDDPETYMAQNTFEMEGLLDVDLMLQAWQRTAAAHPALRTSYHWEDLDKPLQVVHRSAEIPVYRHDWSDLDESEQQVRFDHLMTEDRQAGFFSLSQPPLVRVHLIRLGENRHGCIWTHHMLPMDAWSEIVVMNDVMAWYRHLALGGPLPDQPAPYRDYIGWLQRQDLDAAKDFWSSYLGQGAAAPRLGPLLPEPQSSTAGAVSEHQVLLSPEMGEALRAAAARHRVTFNTLVQAAWSLVLQRYTGEAEVTFGCTSSGRPADLPGVDRMAGSFINSLPVRVTVPDDSDLGAWLREVQDSASAVRRYEYSPLSQIKTWTGVPGPEPLFNSLVVLNNFPSAVTLGSVEQQVSFRLLNAFEKISEPLTLKVHPEPEPSVRLVVHRQRFDPATVDAILADLQAALEALATAERTTGAVAAMPSPRSITPTTKVSYPDADLTLTALVERQARANPDAVAVSTEQETLSYRELLDRAHAIAEAIGAAGSGPGKVVGVCTERAADMVTGIVGVLLSGARLRDLHLRIHRSAQGRRQSRTGRSSTGSCGCRTGSA